MRIIDAKALEREIKEIFQSNPFLMGILLRWVRRQPTIEAEPVRHGRWKPLEKRFDGDLDWYCCSDCGKLIGGRVHYNYCPNCGAKMDGDSHEA